MVEWYVTDIWFVFCGKLSNAYVKYCIDAKLVLFIQKGLKSNEMDQNDEKKPN